MTMVNKIGDLTWNNIVLWRWYC